MPDFDANDGLARLPGHVPGKRLEPAFSFTAILRYLDVALVVIGTPVALALGAPVLGCVIGAVAWLAQRVLAQLDRQWILSAAEPRTQLGLNLFEAFGRIWLLAGAIVVAAVVGGRVDGLAASITVFGAYSVAFAIRLLSGRPMPGGGR
ncbi:MAG TPA: hypothetical protein VMD79_05050 [Solirubrobacteraceae bacterium]|nr:hypothetical protein [Solirubrobacteraceae bacterium]